VLDQPKGYHFGWLSQVLPFCELKNTYNHLNFKLGVYESANSTVRTMVIRGFLCPSDPGSTRGAGMVAKSSYSGMQNDAESPISAKDNGVFFLNSAIRYEDVTDGTSQTLFVGEKKIDVLDLGWASGTRATLRNAGSPLNASRAGSSTIAASANPISSAAEDDSDSGPGTPTFVGGFSSNHPGGANFTFGDGSVRFVKTSISVGIYQQLANRADGELLSSDQF
jgi:prepilin-type processing-associated H-X9-DG protein